MLLQLYIKEISSENTTKKIFISSSVIPLKGDEYYDMTKAPTLRIKKYLSQQRNERTI